MERVYFHISAEIWGGIFCIVASIVLFLTRRFDRKAALDLIIVTLCCATLMAFDVVPWMLSGEGDNVYFISRVTNFISRALSLLVLPLVAEYISHIIYIRTKGYKIYWSMVEWILFFVGVVALIANEIHPYIYKIKSDGSLARLPNFFWIPGALVFTGLLMTLSVAIVYIRYMNNIERAVLIVFLVLPMLAIALRVFIHIDYYTDIAIVISVMTMFISYEMNYADYMIKREKQLHDEKIRIINDQMKPHFIFNSLGTIRYLCRTNVDEAVEAINDFSICMRRITNFIGENSCITADTEIDLVKHYINIQKKRFGNRINIEYDINDEDFDVPPFLIQTLVENSLQHGILDNQIEDGIIIIKTERKGSDHIITITDNGAGFDTNLLKNEKKEHVGLLNTKSRLEIMCGGTLDIQSEPGKGTCVTVTIPE